MTKKPNIITFSKYFSNNHIKTVNWKTDIHFDAYKEPKKVFRKKIPLKILGKKQGFNI